MLLKRDIFGKDITKGKLTVGAHEFFTVEDQVRAPGEKKVFGETAIPSGRYKVTVPLSPNFKKYLPRLHNVPGFEGVLIHGGNTPIDTKGCILPGMKRTLGGVGDSQKAMAIIIPLIESAIGRGESVWITVE